MNNFGTANSCYILLLFVLIYYFFVFAADVNVCEGFHYSFWDYINYCCGKIAHIE